MLLEGQVNYLHRYHNQSAVMEEADNLVKAVNAKLGVLELTRKQIEANLDDNTILDNSREIEKRKKTK